MKPPATLIRQLLLAGLCALPALAVARPVTPFYTHDQSPLAELYGLPALQEARLLNAGEQRYRLVAELANNYTVGKAENEELLFDGETTRVVLDFAGHLGPRLEWGLQIPYVNHSPGVLDGLIRRWHDAFGLPQGGRERAPDERLDYHYVRNGETQFEQRLPSEGLGDIRLGGGWQLIQPREGQENALALRASVKFPTGDSMLLHGSGGTDLALWLSGAHGGYGLGVSGSVFAGVGMLLMERGDVLPEQQRQRVAFGSLGAGAWLHPSLSLKLQLDYHGALYRDSELTQLAQDTLQLSMGGSLRLIKYTEIELGVMEDVAVDTAPDVVFHLAITVSE